MSKLFTVWSKLYQNWNMPTNIVIFKEPDKILMPIGPVRQIFIVNVPKASRSKYAVYYTYTT
jgi:hypothetical protein